MKIHDSERRQLCEYARTAYPDECCGVVLGKREEGMISEIVPIHNEDESASRRVHFAIDPLKLYQVERDAAKRGLEVIGFYHSHADYPAVLSQEDERFMVPGCYYVIVSVEEGQCRDVKGYRKISVKNDSIVQETL